MQAAQSIAQALDEPNVEGVQSVIDVIGETEAYRYLVEAARIETEGGLMVHKGKRRRTPGGVWFHLIRKGVAPDQRKQIWPTGTMKKAPTNGG